MPRKIYVPIWNTNIDEANRDAYLNDLKMIGASTVFFAVDRAILFTSDCCKEMLQLSQNIEFFRKNGFEVGAWFQGFGFGDPIPEKHAARASRYTKLRSVIGVDASGDALCPLNKDFSKDYFACLESIAMTLPDLIMIDDDMCLSVRPGLGCFCPEHINLMEKELGSSLHGCDLPKLFFTGEKNKYRSAWLSVMDKTLSDFCLKARQSVDCVSPDIRLGLASGYTSWDIEGADAIKLSQILAGKTKPFIRLTGAPYWMSKNVDRFKGQQLASAIETARIQEAWCRNSGIEIFSEADSYPRPRYHIPSSFIECFDLATAASGGMGVLKYFYDYRLPFGHESGYSRHHIHNRPLYDAITEHFNGKDAVGVRVYENMRKIESSDLSNDFIGEAEIMSRFFSPAATMLGLLSIPTTHTDASDIGIAFGENVHTLEKLPKRLIIDLSAAEALMKKGVDIGVTETRPAPIPEFEIFGREKAVNYNGHGRFAKFTLKASARTVTEFSAEDELFPASHIYDNGSTKFFVLGFDAYSVRQNSALFLSYIRQKTLLDFVGKIPHISNNPCVWTIVKRDKHETAILYLNIFEDPLLDATIKLDKVYSSALLTGAKGTFIGDSIHLSEPVPPYGAFTVILKN